MTILGIHTDVPDKNNPFSSHAWITIEKDGETKDFALYSQRYEQLRECDQEQGWNNSGTHVREGMDTDRISTQSLYQEITPEQEAKFWQWMEQDQKYDKEHNNCTHWATNAWEKTTGQTLEAKHEFSYTINDINGTKTLAAPVGLEETLIKLKGQEQDLAKDSPKEPTPTQTQEPASKRLGFFEDKPQDRDNQPPSQETPSGKPNKVLSFYEDRHQDNSKDHDR